MNDLRVDLERMLVRDLEAFIREVRLLPEDAQLWQSVPGVANPVGVLARHVAGNLRHYLGQVLGGMAYRRDRTGEFFRRDGSREGLAKELEAAVEAVRVTLSGLDPARLEEPFPEPVGGVTLPTGRFLVHLAVHLGFHLGQAGMVRRVLTGESKSSGPLELAVLAD